MERVLFAFYILIGILVTPSFIVMEEMFHPKTYKSKNNFLIFFRTVSYYFIWPLVLLYYFIQIIKYSNKRN